MEHNIEKEEAISNNPEDCKDTIFSGEGEILGSAGETKDHDATALNINNKDITDKEIIKHLKTENQHLRAYIKKI